MQKAPPLDMFGHHRRSFAAALVPSRRHLSRLYTVSIDTAPCAPVASHAICSLHAAAGMPRARATRRHSALTRSRGPWLGAGCPSAAPARGASYASLSGRRAYTPLPPVRAPSPSPLADVACTPAFRTQTWALTPHAGTQSHQHILDTHAHAHALARPPRPPGGTPRGEG